MAVHPHGTVHRYRSGGCRCRLCTAASTRAQNGYRLAILSGDHRPDVDAEPVRQHIQRLREGGLSLRLIADMAGVSKGVLEGLMYGGPSQGRTPSSKMRAGNADKLLAVRAGQRIGAA